LAPWRGRFVVRASFLFGQAGVNYGQDKKNGMPMYQTMIPRARFAEAK
jgi:hypothetical protein